VSSKNTCLPKRKKAKKLHATYSLQIFYGITEKRKQKVKLILKNSIFKETNIGSDRN